MDKYIEVTFPNGEKWQIPARIIADDRALYYEKLDEDCEYQDEYNYALENNDILLDWAQGDMNWEDVEHSAIRIAPATPLTEEQKNEAWINNTTVVVR